MSVGAAESQADKATQADAEAQEAEVEAQQIEAQTLTRRVLSFFV